MTVTMLIWNAVESAERSAARLDAQASSAARSFAHRAGSQVLRAS
jgi:hypothetical protein